MQVSRLGFGGAEIGYEKASDRDVDAIVAAAIDAGVNVFDTAECYLDSEEKLGRALQGRRDQVFVFTKCGHASGLDGEDWSPDMLSRSIDRSLQNLRIGLRRSAAAALLFGGGAAPRGRDRGARACARGREDAVHRIQR